MHFEAQRALQELEFIIEPFRNSAQIVLTDVPLEFEG